MATEELVHDRYVKTQQAATVTEKYRGPQWYMGTIGQSANDRIGSVPTEQLWGYLASHGSSLGAATLIIIEHEEPVVQEEPVAFQTGNVESANFLMVAKGRLEGVYATLRSSETGLTAGAVAEELKQLLRYRTQDEVEVYPGYWVSSTEYERRFKGVDLEHFRNVLPFELFKAYVRTMGSIHGWGIEPKHRYRGKD